MDVGGGIEEGGFACSTHSRFCSVFRTINLARKTTSCINRRRTNREEEADVKTFDHQEAQRKEEGSPTELPPVCLADYHVVRALFDESKSSEVYEWFTRFNG